MKVWDFIKENPTVVLIANGIVVCLLLIGLQVSYLMGNVSAKEFLGSGLFLTAVGVAFVVPYFAVLILRGKR